MSFFSLPAVRLPDVALQEFCWGLITRMTWSQIGVPLPSLLPSATRSQKSVKSCWEPLRNVHAYFRKSIKSILKEEFVGEISHIVKNTIGHLQEIHNDSSCVPDLSLSGMFPYRGHTFVDAHRYLCCFICTGDQCQYSMVQVG